MCQQPLYAKYISSGETSYRCPQMATGSIQLPNYSMSVMVSAVEPKVHTYKIETHTYKIETPHYEVALDYTGATPKFTQTSIFLPYCMITIAGSSRTKILTWPRQSDVMDIPLLLPDREPDKMAERIKLLVLFS
jgi:hypothetical protein